MKKLTKEEMKILNDFENNRSKGNELKKDRKIILSVGTNTIKLLEKIFNEKINN